MLRARVPSWMLLLPPLVACAASGCSGSTHAAEPGPDGGGALADSAAEGDGSSPADSAGSGSDAGGDDAATGQDSAGKGRDAGGGDGGKGDAGSAGGVWVIGYYSSWDDPA